MKYYINFIIRLLLCFIPIRIFSFLFTKITVIASYLLLIYHNPAVIGDSILIGSHNFEFVEACIVPYAYYFFWVLCLLTKDIIIKTRIKIIIYGFALIFIMNILRIFIVINLAVVYGDFWFNTVHLFFWKFLSGVYVALVWVIFVFLYKIDSIPIYDDFKELYKRAFKNKYY